MNGHRFIFLLFLLSFSFLLNGQNVIIGSNGFLTRGIVEDGGGVGVYARMGIEAYNSEIGIKSHYGNFNDLESYGVSLYTFVPFYDFKKWQALLHAEGGFSFVYSAWGGSERSFLTGLGPSVRYNLKEYFQIEFTVEYVVFASISQEAPLYTHLLIPTIGWSVRI